ncbi:MAG: tRNA-dihydrouridine synthase, partial [Planococcus donghaensis]
VRGVGELRNQLMYTETTDQVRALLDEFEATNEAENSVETNV